MNFNDLDCVFIGVKYVTNSSILKLTTEAGGHKHLVIPACLAILRPPRILLLATTRDALFEK